MKSVKKIRVRNATKWTRFHQLLHDNHGVRYFVMAVGITLATGIGVLAWMWQQPRANTPDTFAVKTSKPTAQKYYSPLTGVEVVDENATKRQVTAVMIENSPDARPQSGLKEAGVVYEAVTEGGITRFIALYQESRPGLVGPVRSLRPYFVEWAHAYDPAVAHVGGSEQALSMIRSGDYGLDIDQFFNGSSYWRSSDRSAPHNVYTSFDNLDTLTASKSKTTSSFTATPRKDDSKASTPDARNIHMSVSSKWYNVDYVYDAVTNSYSRSVGGEPHVDREKGQITPKVAIAIEVSVTPLDPKRKQIPTTGIGRAWIFQNGTVIAGTWNRQDTKSPLSFVDSSGKPVALNRGQTWITAVPDGNTPSWQ